MRNLFTKLALLAILIASPFALTAQDSSAMTGVVTDSTGATLPGTTVTLANPGKGISLTQQTRSDGAYRFPNVPPATGYVVTFSHTGFADVQFSNVALQVGVTRTQDAKLSAGTSVAVEVSASNNAVTLNTTDASIGNNIDVRALTELPIQSRASPAVLFALQPGVSSGSVTGARTDQSEVTLDGLDVNDISTGQTFNINGGGAPVDSVQEFRGVVAGLVPSVGTGSGGQFQLVTKSGTNKFHGNINEYHRDTVTAANTYFNNVAGVPRTPLIQNQFGGNLGGPIFRDKLFFFADFNNSRIVRSNSVLRTVPLDSFRNGNINYILARDANGNACSFTSRLNTTPQCIGTLTPAQVAGLDPQHIGFSQTLLSFINGRFPHANDLTRGDGVNTGGFRFTVPAPDFLYQGVARVDYNLTSKQRFFARYTIAKRDATQTDRFVPTDPQTHPFQDRSYGYVVSHIWQIGNNKVNQFYYGDEVTEFNFPTTFNPTGANQYGFGGGTPGAFTSGPFDSASSQRRRVPIPEVRDDFNWQLGAHNVTFGGTFKFIKTNSSLVNDFNFATLGLGGQLLTLDSSVRPTVANGFATNPIRGGSTAPNDFDNAFALALGRIGSVASQYNYSANGTPFPNGTGETRRYRYYQTEAYIGDTWKINPQLTVTYGVRYQLYTVPYEVSGAQANQNTSFDQYFSARLKQSATSQEGVSAVPLITYNLGGKANNAPPLYRPSYKDFAPRLAFAYNPAYSPHTVINGSVGLVYDRTVINAVNFIQDQSSYLFQNSATKQYGTQTGARANLLADPRIGANLAFANPNTAPVITKPFTPFVDNAQGTDPNDPFGVPGAPFGTATSQFNTIVDPGLKDPYSIAVNMGIQQEFQGHLIMRLNYAGRFGRRLLAQADASQLVEFLDPASGQSLSQAFANLTLQGRAGQSFTPQPFFENQVGPGLTVPLANAFSTLVNVGDFADFIQALQGNGFLNFNVGLASQFSENTFLTNKGSSVYHGLLFTLTKNFSQGLQFDFNYTLSHSIDNTSAVANFIAGGQGFGFVCDATNLRECRANSDFDRTTVINSDFVYALPIGRGKPFLGQSSTLLDEAIGGWSVSAIPAWSSGVAFTAFSNAFVAGFANNAPAIFNGNRGDVATHITKSANGEVDAFRNNGTAAAAFSGPVGFTIGSRNNLRGPSQFNMDAGLAKRFIILPNDRLNLQFRADFFNVLNHPTFATPNSDITSGQFGQITATSNGARVGQFSLRLDF
ncbi:MAG: TonB-dependent receptor [Acidobacteriaceae bacterium]